MRVLKPGKHFHEEFASRAQSNRVYKSMSKFQMRHYGIFQMRRVNNKIYFYCPEEIHG